MDRMILHSDINACYASIELLRHPELRGRPVAGHGVAHAVARQPVRQQRVAGMVGIEPGQDGIGLGVEDEFPALEAHDGMGRDAAATHDGGYLLPLSLR